MVDAGERLGGDDLTFSVDEPLRIIIGGPPHSGKSTLMNLLEDKFRHYQVPVELLDLDLSAPTPLKSGFTQERTKKDWTAALAQEAQSLFKDTEGVDIVLGDSVGLISSVNEIISQPADVAILLVSGGHGDSDSTYRKVVRKWKDYYQDIHKPLLVVVRSSMNPDDESMFDPRDNYGVMVGLDTDAYMDDLIETDNACLEGIVFEIAQSFDLIMRSAIGEYHLDLLMGKWPNLRDKKTWTPLPDHPHLATIERDYFQKRGKIPADQMAESFAARTWDKESRSWIDHIYTCAECGFADYDDEAVWRIDGMCRKCKQFSDNSTPPPPQKRRYEEYDESDGLYCRKCATTELKHFAYIRDDNLCIDCSKVPSARTRPATESFGASGPTNVSVTTSSSGKDWAKFSFDQSNVWYEGGCGFCERTIEDGEDAYFDMEGGDYPICQDCYDQHTPQELWRRTESFGAEHGSGQDCCFCGDTIIGYGNNPAPLDEFPNKCCSDCNLELVIPARMRMMFEGRSESFGAEKCLHRDGHDSDNHEWLDDGCDMVYDDGKIYGSGNFVCRYCGEDRYVAFDQKSKLSKYAESFGAEQCDCEHWWFVCPDCGYDTEEWDDENSCPKGCMEEGYDGNDHPTKLKEYARCDIHGEGFDPKYAESFGAESFAAMHNMDAKEIETLYAYVEYLEDKCGNHYEAFIDEGLDPYRTNAESFGAEYDVMCGSCGDYEAVVNCDNPPCQMQLCSSCRRQHKKGNHWITIIDEENDVAFEGCDGCHREVGYVWDNTPIGKTEAGIPMQRGGWIRDFSAESCPHSTVTKHREFQPFEQQWAEWEECDKCGFVLNAEESFAAPLTFNQWSDDEKHESSHQGGDTYFEDWLDEEIHSHGKGISLKRWGDEEESEGEHQHAESKPYSPILIGAFIGLGTGLWAMKQIHDRKYA